MKVAWLMYLLGALDNSEQRPRMGYLYLNVVRHENLVTRKCSSSRSTFVDVYSGDSRVANVQGMTIRDLGVQSIWN